MIGKGGKMTNDSAVEVIQKLQSEVESAKSNLVRLEERKAAAERQIEVLEKQLADLGITSAEDIKTLEETVNKLAGQAQTVLAQAQALRGEGL